MTTKKLSLFLFLIFFSEGFSQTLPLKEALENGIANYGTIKAKSNYADASKETIKQVRREYLPNVTLSGQQDFGTVNGQNGPLYGFGGLGVASSGLPLEKQNWNAAFGALYLVNVNWDFFTFGRMKQKINLSKADSQRYEKDLDQEKFQHKIKIAAAYLNLLASQRLLISQRKNLERAMVFQNIAAVRVKNGLLAGVDSTLASAEVSRSKITLNQVKDQVKEQNNKLIALMGVSIQDFVLDTTFVTTIPKAILSQETSSENLNPILEYHKSRVAFSEQQLRLFKKEYYPTFSLFGIYQARASGFNSDYAVNQNSFSQNYLDGIDPSRQNYLLGVGVTWNLTTIARVSKKVSAQKLISEGLQEEYKVIDQQLKIQSDAADAKIKYALENYVEAPKQVQAAQQAYLQKTTLYKNGMTNLLDVTQTLYTLNRAETDRDIIYTNVWQSLLMKAAATGDFDLFMNEF
ncbi:TolC family protein [Flavobacterium gawalongense]|uniref:TolC family protein n=1 Tax=Flavobacterium gawalongense TaxID=2594432 RepID=A0A553BCR7_9FLAO|nr:TolC family protein [Flavobacterium gawalongense]TRW98561.1 TolC family protein [Flavobacterium gawalongense]TRX03082.1 TolC family protein [Flavobacterium gawalongense]TRX06046.1 TolC family protein [Flavobacterium gawalongense]TRX10974.1 TolC family protein [Flavobacterium gawalongense]TRX22606.1 TolC family protein [Flavobacterium gawalongense]